MNVRVRILYTGVALAVMTAISCAAQDTVTTPVTSPDYDLILKGGHVLDAKNHVDGVIDVAIKDGLIAKVAKDIPATDGVKAVELNGLYVTPGLIDIHVHVYAGTGVRASIEGDLSVYPDGFTFRNGVTTVVDAGSSGWRTFPDFKDRVIDRSQTRVLAMLNIVGTGITHTIQEQNMDDMKAEAAAAMALKYPGLIVGIKSAHFTGPEWTPYEQAVKAGTIAHIPVMIDYGSRRLSGRCMSCWSGCCGREIFIRTLTRGFGESRTLRRAGRGRECGRAGRAGFISMWGMGRAAFRGPSRCRW